MFLLPTGLPRGFGCLATAFCEVLGLLAAQELALLSLFVVAVAVVVVVAFELFVVVVVAAVVSVVAVAAVVAADVVAVDVAVVDVAAAAGVLETDFQTMSSPRAVVVATPMAPAPQVRAAKTCC